MKIFQGLRSRRHLGHDNRVEAQVADGALEVNLVGSCFNATFAIIKHIERCPWCPDEHVVISEKDEVNQPQTMSFSFKDQTFLFGIAIVTMSLIIVIIGIIICFCILRCNKRKANNFKNQKQANINMYHQRPLPQGHYYTMKQKVELLKKSHADEDEHHYQIPVLPNENRDNGFVIFLFLYFTSFFFVDMMHLGTENSVLVLNIGMVQCHINQK